MGYKKILKDIIKTMLLLLGASMIGCFFRFFQVDEINIVIIYLLAVVLIVSWSEGYSIGIIASILATFMFNYFFTEPIFTFEVNDPSYFITFIIMTITSMITSTLTGKIRKNEREAKERERETFALYDLTNHLTEAKNMNEIAENAVDIIGNVFNCQAVCFYFLKEKEAETIMVQKLENKKIQKELTNRLTKEEWEINLKNGCSIGEEFYDWPIYIRKTIIGVIRIPKEKGEKMTIKDKTLLLTMIESIALAMDRLLTMEQQIRSRDETMQERYRGNLLRAISHDLRTPLSGIIGSAEMIKDMTEPDDIRYEISTGIQEEAEWLHSLVENILSLTRLQDGHLVIQKEDEAVEEVISTAIEKVSKRREYHEINVQLPEEILMVPMDIKLISQVLINLIDNAIKHTEKEEEICVSVYKDQVHKEAVFLVSDRGEGIKESDLPNIFQMFYTSRQRAADAKQGIGLGLAICDTIVTAHGGKISARNRSDGKGAEFKFTLPLTKKNSVEE